MAEVKSEHIAVNELRALSKDALNMMFEGSRIRIAWAEGKRVWDVWGTILSASNTISIESKATTLTKSLLNLQSYGTDRLGVNHDMAYTISPTSISANTSTSSKTHTVTVKQTATGKSVSVTATQAGRVATKTIYKTPSVTSTSISTVPASGNVTRKLTVYWSQVKETTYDNDTTSTETVTGSSTATITSGSENNSSGAYISGGGVYVPSAGTTYYTSQRTAFTISKFTFTANEVSSGTVSRTVYVYQSANTRSTYYRNYKVSLSSSRDSLNSVSDTTTITVTSTKESYYRYASGSEQTIGNVSCNANLSTSDGQFYRNGTYSTSVTLANGGTVTFVPNANETIYDRTLSIKAVNTDSSSTSYTLSIKQMKAEFELTIKGQSSISASGGTISLNVVNTMNGGFLTLGTSDVTVTNGYVESVEFNDVTMESWTVTVRINQNTTTSSRNAVVKVTQPKSGDVATHTITQAAASSGQTTYRAAIDAWWDGYTAWYTVLVSSTSSSYETVDIVVKLQDSYDKYGYVYYEESINLITNMDEHNGSYDLGYYIDPLYVVVYHDNEIIGYKFVN